MRASLYSAEPQDYKSVTMLPAALLTQLRTAVGSDGVIDRPEALLVYECDGYTLERAAPEVVVLPRTPAEVAAVLRLLAAERIPFVPRGAGTGLSGGTLPVEAPVMVGTSRLTAIEAIDVANRRIVAQAGVVNQWVTNAVRAHGLCYAPDPSSQPACTIGGNIAENSGGPHTLKYGVTTNHVLGVELVLASGQVVTLGGAVEDRPGYDLVGLVVGAEGTFGIVTRATLRLVRAPEAYRTLLAVFEAVDASAARTACARCAWRATRRSVRRSGNAASAPSAPSAGSRPTTARRTASCRGPACPTSCATSRRRPSATGSASPTSSTPATATSTPSSSSTNATGTRCGACWRRAARSWRRASRSAGA